MIPAVVKAKPIPEKKGTSFDAVLSELRHFGFKRFANKLTNDSHKSASVVVSVGLYKAE